MLSISCHVEYNYPSRPSLRMSSTTTTMAEKLAGRLRNILRKPESPPDNTEDVTTVVEPTSLALRIQSLIDNLPTPTTKTIVRNPKPPQCDKNGRPIAPSGPIRDSGLIKALNSASIMNGSTDKNNFRPSIWSILETMGAPQHQDDSPPDNPRTNPRDGEDDIPDIYSEASSVMVYSPLIPNQNSQVELAESQVIVKGNQIDKQVPLPDPSNPDWSWGHILPSVTSWFTQQNPPPTPSDTLIDPQSRERGIQALATRVWIPSKDKLSIQCMWWGYRM